MRKNIRRLGPLLVLVAIAIITGGIVLQWRLYHVSVNPQLIAYLGHERHLVTTIQASAVGLLNWNDDTKARTRLWNLKRAAHDWEKNHQLLSEAVKKPGVESQIGSEIQNQILPRYQLLDNAVSGILQMADTVSALELSEIKPLVRSVEEISELYIFFLDHLDLKLANYGRERISEIRGAEGILIIVSGLILLTALFWLFFPALRALESYDGKIQELLEELRDKNSQLSSLYFQVEKKAEGLTERINTMAHEVRTPLSTVSMSIDLLRREELRPGDNLAAGRERIYETMKRGVLAANDMLREFLDMTRIEGGLERVVCVETSLPNLLKRVEEQARARIERRNLQFHLVMEQGCPQLIHSDPKKLERALINLLGNAAKYSDKGHVTLKAGPCNVHPWLKGELVSISVSDTGIGIAPESLEKLFTPFFTPNQRSGSVGLGLVITRKLVHLLGGEISVESKPGKGSTFTLTIPAVLPNSSEAEAAATPFSQKNNVGILSALTANLQLQSTKLLMVEDSEDLREVTSRFLENAGISVEAVPSGKEALSALAQEDALFDLVLLDMKLPDFTGIKLVQEIRELQPGIPIIAMTAFAGRFSRSQCLAAGFNDFLEKPISPATLSALLVQYATKRKVATESDALTT